MTLLITGASGFIGSRLVRQAVADWGADKVIALSSRPVPGCDTIVHGADADGRFTLGDADLARIAAVQVVVHAGAYTPKSGAEANAVAACNSNIGFTGSLLALPWPALRRIVYLSTLDVYASVPGCICEATPTQPASLYGASKLYGEHMVRAMAAGRGLSAVILRIGHVYGPGEERYAKFLPKAIRQIVDGQPVELFGDGADLRSFIYIDDVVQAVLAATGRSGIDGVTNVVGGQAISIRQLLDRLILLSGRPVQVVQRAAGGARRDFVFDTGRLRERLLATETPLDQGLRAELAHIERLR